MNRIVIDARISGTTTGRYIDKVVEHLHKLAAASEYSFTILVRADRLDYMKQLAPNFTVLESPYADFSFGEQLGLAWQLYRLKADLVHFPMVQQPVLYLKPKVTSMLDLTTLRFIDPTKNILIFKLKQKVYRVVNWLAAKTSRQIITISNFVKRDVAKTFHISKNKITTTYNAADEINEPSEELPNLKSKGFIFYTGRPQPHKNLPRLIQAFVILQKNYPDLVLVLGGKADALYERVAQDVQDQDIKNILFTGFVSEGELKWLYQNTKAYVFPSLSEGFGLPGLEAMVHGAPVVSSNSTCLPEIYKEAALYFDPLDTHDMAEKISQVLSSTELAESLRKKGKQLAQTYSWQETGQLTLDTYNKALGDRS